MKGSYLLLIKLEKNKLISYGLKNEYYFKKGYYTYIGSGLNSLEKRIERHLNKNKKIFWHIDYLLKYSNIVKIYYIEKNKKIECEIAELLQKKFSQINKFGSSDCSCKSHLFYVSKNKFQDFIKKTNFLEYKQKI
jgi:Uri superfamily endonuclease